MNRDRDRSGRARNARPRDGLGRPLPRDAQGMARQPEGVRREPGETLDEAQRLLDAGLPFHAHEVLEDAWKSATDPERALWKGLAQLAVGLTTRRAETPQARRPCCGAGRTASRGTAGRTRTASTWPAW